MNPELAPSLVVITVSTAVWITIAACLGMVFALYCGYRLSGLSRKQKPGAKPKTYIKVHHFTLEQTLTLAGLWDEMDSGKRLAKVKFWQTLRTMVPEEDNHESMEIENVNHSRWNVKITKEGEEPKPKNPPAPVLPESLIAPKPEEPKP